MKVEQLKDFDVLGEELKFDSSSHEKVGYIGNNNNNNNDNNDDSHCE